MENLQLHWIGEMSLKNVVFESVMDEIQSTTSEHDGKVKAVVLVTESIFSGKIPVVCNDALYLSVFRDRYVLFFTLNEVNVTDMIFMYDNEFVNFSDLHINLNQEDFVKMFS